MTLDTKKIIQLRQDFGWSQEHLADVAGLSVRTIQRVEQDGACSPETQMALASAFTCSPKDLALAVPDQLGAGGISISGVSGFSIVCLIAAAAIALSVDPLFLVNWPSALFVVGVGCALTAASSGFGGMFRSLGRLRWLVADPDHQTDVGQTLGTWRRMILHVHAAGLMGAGLALLQMAFNNAFGQPEAMVNVAVALLPVVYATLIAEAVIRPTKLKIERMVLAAP